MRCCPVCHLPSPFVHRSFPSTPHVPPPPRILLVWCFTTPPVAPPPLICSDTTHGGCAALPTQLTFMNRSTASGTPRYHFPVFFVAVTHSAVSTPNTKGASSVDPSLARGSPRSSNMHLCQVLSCPPDLRFSSPAIVLNPFRTAVPFWGQITYKVTVLSPQRNCGSKRVKIIRLGICLLCCATLSEKKKTLFTDGCFDPLATSFFSCVGIANMPKIRLQETQPNWFQPTVF